MFQLLTYKFFLAVIFCGLLTAAFLGIYLYNSNVDLNHRLAEKEEQLRNLQASGAELKGRLLELMATANFDRLVTNLGLVKISHPEYLPALIWGPVSASQF